MSQQRVHMVFLQMTTRKKRKKESQEMKHICPIHLGKILVCMYVCMYVCVYVCVYVCLYVCSVPASDCKEKEKKRVSGDEAHLSNTCGKDSGIYAHVYVCPHTHTHTYTHTHTSHTYTHPHTQTPKETRPAGVPTMVKV